MTPDVEMMNCATREPDVWPRQNGRVVEKRSARRGLWLCAAAALCFGAATPISRRLLAEFDSVTLAGVLYVGAALAAAPVASRQQSPRRVRADWVKLAVAVVIGGGVSPVLLLLGLDRVASPTVSILLNLELVATVVLAWAVYRERIDRFTSVGAALVVAAGVALAWNGGVTVGPAAMLVALACVGWGIDNSTTANLIAFTPAQITTAKGVVAGTANLCIGIVFFGGIHASVVTVLGALAVGAIGYGVSIMLWIAGARSIGAARGQAVFATAPFIGVLLAWPILGEHLTYTTGVAFGFAAVGVTLVSINHVAPLHRHTATVHSHWHRHDDVHHDHHDIGTPLRHRHAHAHDAVEHAHTRRHTARSRPRR